VAGALHRRWRLGRALGTDRRAGWRVLGSLAAYFGEARALRSAERDTAVYAARTILPTGFATNAAELAVGGAVSGSFSLLRKPIAAAALAERIQVLVAGIESRST
jgi:hypothetical protein